MANESFVITAANGTAFDLSGLVNYAGLRGMTGHLLTDVTLQEDVTPLQPGSYLNSVVVRSRTMSIPVLYKSTSRQAFLTLRRTLAAALNPEQGAGYITYTDTTGAARKLSEVYVTSGLGGNTAEGVAGVGWEKSIIRIKALDPYWYSTSLTSNTFTKTAAAGNFLGDPFLPIKLYDSGLYSSKTINNPGNITAYPYWVITGEFTSISLINETTNKTLTLVYSLPDLDQITVDCRQRRSQTPNGKKVIYGTTDLFQYLTAYDFWGFEPGNNVVRIEAENTGSGTAFAVHFYTPYASI